MPILSFQNKTYSCDRAQKGRDFIRLLDSSGNSLFVADGISDFSDYILTDGDWETSYALLAPTVGAAATSDNGIITLAISPAVRVENGIQINFTAPCDSTVTQCLQIAGENYTVVDAKGECVTGKDGRWAAGAVVSVILDVDTKKAFVQNAAVVDPYTREETLSPETAELFGLYGKDATPDDAFRTLSKLYLHCWKRRTSGWVAQQSGSTLTNLALTNFTSTSATGNVQYSETVTISSDYTTVSLDNPKTLAVGYDTYTEANVLAGKYILPAVATGASSSTIYYAPPTATATQTTTGTGYYRAAMSEAYAVAPALVVGEWEYVYSSSRNAYPDSGIVDGVEYVYCGVPFDNAARAHVKIETGSYSGTGKANPTDNSLTFDFAPKFLIVQPFDPTNNILYDLLPGSGGSYFYSAIWNLAAYERRSSFLVRSKETGQDSYGSCTVTITNDGKTVSWSSDSANAAMQLNYSGYIYYYFAIG